MSAGTRDRKQFLGHFVKSGPHRGAQRLGDPRRPQYSSTPGWSVRAFLLGTHAAVPDGHQHQKCIRTPVSAIGHSHPAQHVFRWPAISDFGDYFKREGH